MTEEREEPGTPLDGGLEAVPTPPAVKICGVGRPRDLRAAAAAGADFVGLVLAESPRRIGVGEAERLARRAAGLGLAPVGVFVDRPSSDVRRLVRRLRLRAAQLHGEETPRACRSVREAGAEVWKAVRPRSRRELRELADRYAGSVDALLVEGYSPEAAGGTGTSVPWSWLREPDGGRIAPRLVLAGGLDPSNVAEAIRQVEPEVVDVSSGVEAAPGRKDAGRIRAFVEAARRSSPRRRPGGPDGSPRSADPRRADGGPRPGERT